MFDAPPGSIELRMSVEAAAAAACSTGDPDDRRAGSHAPQAAISTPRVHRARTARELQTVAADAAAVPVAGREFSRTERLLIRFDVYGNATPTAVLLNRNGQKMADVPVTPADGRRHASDRPGSQRRSPAGEYLVEITVKGATGEARSWSRFGVGT